MNDLQANIDWLKKSPANRIEVYDAVTEKAIDKNLSAAGILSNFDNIEAYFKSLEEKGNIKIAVQKARKQGNTQVREGLLNKYLLGDQTSQSVAASGGQAQAGPAVQQTQNPAGLLGAVGAMGLSMPQIMQMHTASEKYGEKKTEAERLQKRVDELEAANKLLDREVLRYELGIEAKPGAMEKLMDTLSANPDLITTAIQALSTAKQKAPGLNAPVNADGLSGVKASLVQVISKVEVTDDIALAAYHLINQSINGNTSFTNAFKNILTDHKLIKTE